MKAPAPAPKLWLLHWSSAKAHGPAGGEALLAPEYVENLTCEVKMLEKVCTVTWGCL